MTMEITLYPRNDGQAAVMWGDAFRIHAWKDGPLYLVVDLLGADRMPEFGIHASAETPDALMERTTALLARVNFEPKPDLENLRAVVDATEPSPSEIAEHITDAYTTGADDL